MTKKQKSKEINHRKFGDQIEGFRKAWLEGGGEDLQHLDDIPNFTGEDEPIPFPYGNGPGKDFGQWTNQSNRN